MLPHDIRYLDDLLRKISKDNKTQAILSSHSLAIVATCNPQEIGRIEKDGESTKIFQPSFGALNNENYIKATFQQKEKGILAARQFH